MKYYHKRIFNYKLILIITLLFLFSRGFAAESSTIKILFPRAFSVATDDMGWNEGGSLGNSRGPWRVGFRRHFDVRDYKPLVEIGKAVGMRFQGAFILAEMDRLNVCAKYPTTTMDGKNWDNSTNVGPTQFEVMNYVKDNAAYLEFGIHGVGHENWDNGKRSRAEWYDIENDKPRSIEDNLEHMKCFKEIMAQYGWTPENGHSFPESFVPCCFAYYWNPDGEYSTGKLMHENGVKYVNTVYSYITELNPPFEIGGGFDHGVLVLDRHSFGNPWNEPAALPTKSVEEYDTDFIEAHWANWLATDDEQQPRLNQQWIRFFKKIQAHPEHYLAKNTEQLNSQWLYNRYTTVTEKTEGKVTIDNRNMPEESYKYDLLGNMVLVVKLEEGWYVSEVNLNRKPVSAYFEDEGYGFIYLPPLKKEVYQLEYKIGKNLMPQFINNTGTYNVYDVEITEQEMKFDLKMYGTQVVKVKCPKPVSVSSSNRYLNILTQEYNSENKMLLLEIYGRDMQGEEGEILIKF